MADWAQGVKPVSPAHIFDTLGARTLMELCRAIEDRRTYVGIKVTSTGLPAATPRSGIHSWAYVGNTPADDALFGMYASLGGATRQDDIIRTLLTDMQNALHTCFGAHAAEPDREPYATIVDFDGSPYSGETVDFGLDPDWESNWPAIIENLHLVIEDIIYIELVADNLFSDAVVVNREFVETDWTSETTPVYPLPSQSNTNFAAFVGSTINCRRADSGPANWDTLHNTYFLKEKFSLLNPTSHGGATIEKAYNSGFNWNFVHVVEGTTFETPVGTYIRAKLFRDTDSTEWDAAEAKEDSPFGYVYNYPASGELLEVEVDENTVSAPSTTGEFTWPVSGAGAIDIDDLIAGLYWWVLWEQEVTNDIPEDWVVSTPLNIGDQAGLSLSMEDPFSSDRRSKVILSSIFSL